MIILSHRGFWEHKLEQNTVQAFERSFHHGFGIETDLRDLNGELVISHDIPTGGELPFESFLSLYNSKGKGLFLALNIKSDGLQNKMKVLLEKYNVVNYFVFDMSIPDTLGYLNQDFRIFSRHSEYEPKPSFYEEVSGIWLDEFKGHWITEKIISTHIRENKQVCIVSPELHKRDFQREWLEYKEIEKNLPSEDRLMLCTDFPEKARTFFSTQ